MLTSKDAKGLNVIETAIGLLGPNSPITKTIFVMALSVASREKREQAELSTQMKGGEKKEEGKE